MKNKILLALLIVFSLSACTKSSDDNTGGSNSITVIPATSVPQAARTTFSTNFPGATEVEWHKSGSTFVSQFNQSSQRHEAGFDDSGHQSSHSVICLDAPVPQVVLDAFRQNFATDNVYEWKLTSNGSWKAHIMRGSVKYEATFSAAGALLKFEQA
jgi:hypothetical protein